MTPRKVQQVARFYEANRQGLYTFALSLTHDPEVAEDVIQAAFFKLLRGNRLPRDLRPYVFRSVRNAVIDERRRKHGKRAEIPIHLQQNPRSTATRCATALFSSAWNA